MLAGVYLPRVWWTPGAIEKLAQGQTVKPLIGNTISEIRANDLFRWLRDFGPRFGWRQTGTLTKLQQEANQGAVCLIVARRKEDGKSGHIVAVVPETESASAARNSAGEVVRPLQSQAGSKNFRRDQAVSTGGRATSSPRALSGYTHSDRLTGGARTPAPGNNNGAASTFCGVQRLASSFMI